MYSMHFDNAQVGSSFTATCVFKPDGQAWQPLTSSGSVISQIWYKQARLQFNKCHLLQKWHFQWTSLAYTSDQVDRNRAHSKTDARFPSFGKSSCTLTCWCTSQMPNQMSASSSCQTQVLSVPMRESLDFSCDEGLEKPHLRFSHCGANVEFHITAGHKSKRRWPKQLGEGL